MSEWPGCPFCHAPMCLDAAEWQPAFEYSDSHSIPSHLMVRYTTHYFCSCDNQVTRLSREKVSHVKWQDVPSKG